MKNYKTILLIVCINICASMFIVYISPRFDIITLLYFTVLNMILFFALSFNEQRKEGVIEEKINAIFLLLHSLDADSNNYEVMDDKFGRLRDEIIKVIVENKRMADKATNNGQILREYTEDIAHQIKTPLTGALLILDLMEEDRENNKEYVFHIRDKINRLHHLVDILLKLASLDSGAIEMKKEAVHIKELIDGIVSDLETYFIKDNWKIGIHGDEFTLICDKRWTYEAIFNIVKNGIEASLNKGVEIYFKETNLFKSIIVEDFGKGMDKETLKKAYRRFYKENSNAKGYGIGLPMAKTIMEKQGGELLYTKGKISNTFELRFYKG